MSRIIAVLCISISVLLSICPAAENEISNYHVLRMSDGKVISFSEMLDEVKDSKIIFIGENHDDKRHHEFQLKVIRSLRSANIPVVIGMEMFTADNQETLDQWLADKIDLLSFLKVYYNDWRTAWPFYRDIFLYAKENNVPVIGLNVGKGITEKVAKNGFQALSADDMKKLPSGISCNIDREYSDFIRKIHGGHATEKSFIFFCEAQIVWDKSMAWHLAKYLKKYPGKTVVVLAGTIHSWKKGIPGQTANFGKYTYTVILPEIPNAAAKDALTTRDADYLMVMQ